MQASRLHQKARQDTGKQIASESQTGKEQSMEKEIEIMMDMETEAAGIETESEVACMETETEIACMEIEVAADMETEFEAAETKNVTKTVTWVEGILYSGWLEEDSAHSLDRAKERAGLCRKKAIRQIDLARTRGIKGEECTWSVDRNFLLNKTNEKKVAVAFNGYCFIFERPTMNCITMFKLPKRFGQKKHFYKDRFEERFDTR